MCSCSQLKFKVWLRLFVNTAPGHYKIITAIDTDLVVTGCWQLMLWKLPLTATLVLKSFEIVNLVKKEGFLSA